MEAYDYHSLAAKVHRMHIIEETNLNFEKQFLEHQKVNLNDLQIFVYDSGNWEKFLLPENSPKIVIGSDPEQCDIIIHNPEAEARQAVIVQLYHQCMVIEIGEKPLMKVNGIERRQGSIAPGNHCFISFGDSKIILGSDIDEPDLGAKFYSLIIEDKQMEMSFDKVCLFGSNEYCDVQVPGEPFIALVSSFRNKLYLYTIMPPTQSDITVNHESVIHEFTALTQHNQLGINNCQLLLKAPTLKKSENGFNIIPGTAKTSMCLMSIKKDKMPGRKFILPPAGRTLFIGRSPDNYFTIESNNVSRKHAQVIVYENHIILNDCHTRNGTSVNGEKITKKLVYPGDFIKLADARFLLCYE